MINTFSGRRRVGPRIEAAQAELIDGVASGRGLTGAYIATENSEIAWIALFLRPYRLHPQHFKVANLSNAFALCGLTHFR